MFTVSAENAHRAFSPQPWLGFEDYSPTKTDPTEIIYARLLVHLYTIYTQPLCFAVYNKLSFKDTVPSPTESPDNLIPVFLYLCLLVCPFFSFHHP